MHADVVTCGGNICTIKYLHILSPTRYQNCRKAGLATVAHPLVVHGQVMGSNLGRLRMLKSVLTAALLGALYNNSQCSGNAVASYFHAR